MNTTRITLKKTLLHFGKILTHKYWVAKYCFKCGLYWQGLTHDNSKFSWIEFWESVRYYQGTSSPINEAKRLKGYSDAWQHHKGRNPHHYEHWTDNYDSGTTTIKMPYKYAVEMICDYLGAARAYMGSEFSYSKEYDWWMKKVMFNPPKMHKQTQEFVTAVFQTLRDLEKEPVYCIHVDVVLNKKFLKHLYHRIDKENGFDFV